MIFIGAKKRNMKKEAKKVALFCVFEIKTTVKSEIS